MKFFILLLAIGFASASVIDDVLEQAAKEIVDDFKKGLEEAPITYAAEDTDAANVAKNELVDSLQSALKDTIEKIKVRVDEKHQKAQDLIEKAKDLAERLKQMRADLGTKTKEFLEDVKGRVTEKVAALIEKIANGGRSKREIEAEEYDGIQEVIFNTLVEQVKAKMMEKMDLNKLKELAQKFTNGEFREMLRNAATRGKDALKEMMNNIMNRSQRQTRSVNEVTDKVKDFFKDMGLNFKERYGQFAEWLKNAWGKALDNAKDKHAKLQEIAREVRDHAKDMRQESVRQAVEILRPFKDQLGDLWQELLTSAKAVLVKKEQ